VAVKVGFWDLLVEVCVGVGELVAGRVSVGVGVLDVVPTAVGVRVFLEGPSGNA
jgi:hypothetical protein